MAGYDGGLKASDFKYVRGDSLPGLSDRINPHRVYGDADVDGYFILKSLQDIKTQNYMRPLPPNQLLDVVKINTTGGAGLRETGFREEDGRASWKRQGDKDGKFEEAENKILENTFKVLPYISGYAYMLREFESAQRSGFPLEARRAFLCRQAYFDLVIRSVLVGEPTEGVTGFLNDESIENRKQYKTPLSVTSTAQECYDRLVEIFNSVMDKSNETAQRPTDMLVPGALYRLCEDKQFGNGEKESVLERFERVKKCKLREIESLTSVTDGLVKGTNSTTARSYAICGVFNDMTHEKMIPIPFQQRPSHEAENGFKTVVPCRCEIGGLHIYSPTQFAVRSNIFAAA